MSSIISKSSIGLCLAVLVAVCLFGMGYAGESAQDIDARLDAVSANLNQELDRATRQIHEAERLGQSSSVANQYGNAADIDRQIQQTVDEANRDLRMSAQEIEYRERRTEIERNRSQYYPGTSDYIRLSNEIRNLDDQFQRTGRVADL